MKLRGMKEEEVWVWMKWRGKEKEGGRCEFRRRKCRR
jgi:hypothetical protein